MNQDLKELARLKIKLDLIEELYKSKLDQLRPILKEHKIIEDPDGILTLKLIESDVREFSVEGVRKTLGEKATLCIEEVVSAKKFDACTKKGKNYLLTEDQLQHCFTIKTRETPQWTGLDTYKLKLKDQVNNGN